ncbi:MAG: hypothetical protein JWQ97_3717 [Phenylobacterium sp.]|nr:hypothetical protein [Phenylobacterium sp.]
MTDDLDESAIDAIERLLRPLNRGQKPSALKALMRLSGNALAALTHHQEAASEHTRLGHQHFVRGARR